MQVSRHPDFLRVQPVTQLQALNHIKHSHHQLVNSVADSNQAVVVVQPCCNYLHSCCKIVKL